MTHISSERIASIEARKHELAEAMSRADLSPDETPFEAAEGLTLVALPRLLVAPNAFTTVPSDVRLWIDARTPHETRLSAWRVLLEERAARLAGEVEPRRQAEVTA